MGDLAIRVEGIGKRYRLGPHEPYRALRDVLTDMLVAPARWFRRPTPPVSRPVRPQHLWALRDVSFEVPRGEVVGIIGRNGGGKSTLLKLLSRITAPTEGSGEVYGRVGSLLEVGTGFHPELTGRENIYLNGAILGMTKAEIDGKFDQIVAFAEVEPFVDTPVKHYSSGMHVRLAFAVAAHLEPEILLVDEVLAVGDAAFQKKCLGKMSGVAREGRTVLFVSHNMAVINQLCVRGIWLDSGRLRYDGSAPEAVARYLMTMSARGGEQSWPDPERAPGNERVRLHAVRIRSKGEITNEVDIDKDLLVEVEFWNLLPGSRNLCANIYLLDSLGNTVLSTANTPAASLAPNEWFYGPHPAGLFRATCTLPGNFLNEATYYISVYVVTLGPVRVEARAEQALAFTVLDTGVMREPGGGRWDGVVRVRLPWRTEFLGPLELGIGLEAAR